MPELDPQQRRFASLALSIVFAMICAQLTHNPLVGICLGVLTYWLLKENWIVGPNKPLLDPAPKMWRLPRYKIIGILKDNLPTVHFEDRWWTLKNPVDQKTDTLTFAVNWDSQDKSAGGAQPKNQVTLVIVAKDTPEGTVVEQHYELLAPKSVDYDTGISVVKAAIDNIDRMMMKALAERTEG